MNQYLKMKSKIISLFDYEKVDLSQDIPDFKVNFDQLDRDMDRILRSYATIEDKEQIEFGDMVELSCSSKISKFNKSKIVVYIGRNLYSKELEAKLVGLRKGKATIEISNGKIEVDIHRIQKRIVPKMDDETIKKLNIEDIHSVADLKRICVNKQVDRFRDEDEDADMITSKLFSLIMHESEFELDDEEVQQIEVIIQKKLVDVKKENVEEALDCEFNFDDFIADMEMGTLKGAIIGCSLCEQDNKLLTIDDYMEEINKIVVRQNLSQEEAMKRYSQFEFMLDNYSEVYFMKIDHYVGNVMKNYYNNHVERRIYDVAIIGAGPAGISAALNFKLHNKDIIWFGTPKLSDKVNKSEKIANYPGLGMISGKDLNKHFIQQIMEMDLHLTDKMVTDITKTRRCYMLLAENEIYEAKTVLLATGLAVNKGFNNELELLGKGVSYCATCDGFLYKGKTIAVYCGSKRYEHEVTYLAEMVDKLYLYTPYKDYDIELANVEKITSPIQKIVGDNHVEAIELKDGSNICVDGVFIMRNQVAPSALLKGIELNENSIAVDRLMATNKEGCYAAGDCTGSPYQIAKAVGEGNIAAHSIIEYLAK